MLQIDHQPLLYGSPTTCMWDVYNGHNFIFVVPILPELGIQRKRKAFVIY